MRVGLHCGCGVEGHLGLTTPGPWSGGEKSSPCLSADSQGHGLLSSLSPWPSRADGLKSPCLCFWALKKAFSK